MNMKVGDKVVCISENFPWIKKFGGINKRPETPKLNEMLEVDEVLGIFLRFDRYDTEESTNWWIAENFAVVNESSLSVVARHYINQFTEVQINKKKKKRKKERKNMEKILEVLKRLNGIPGIAHLYELVLYSNGSGNLRDENDNYVFSFNNIEEFHTKAEQYISDNTPTKFKIGTKVRFGGTPGTVTREEEKHIYSIYVEFKNGSVCWFTKEGLLEDKHKEPLLLTEEEYQYRKKKLM